MEMFFSSVPLLPVVFGPLVPREMGVCQINLGTKLSINLAASLHGPIFNPLRDIFMSIPPEKWGQLVHFPH